MWCVRGHGLRSSGAMVYGVRGAMRASARQFAVSSEEGTIRTTIDPGAIVTSTSESWLGPARATVSRTLYTTPQRVSTVARLASAEASGHCMEGNGCQIAHHKEEWGRANRTASIVVDSR